MDEYIKLNPKNPNKITSCFTNEIGWKHSSLLIDFLGLKAAKRPQTEE